MKGGHIGGRLRVCRFGFTETPVNRFANCPEGIPVLRADAAPDPEVVGVANYQLGPERQPALKYCLSLEDLWRDGEAISVSIEDTAKTFSITWQGHYTITDDVFTFHEAASGAVTTFMGYPTHQLNQQTSKMLGER